MSNDLKSKWRNAAKLHRAFPDAESQIKSILFEIAQEIPITNPIKVKDTLSLLVKNACAINVDQSICITSFDGIEKIVGFLIVSECNTFIRNHSEIKLFHLELSYAGVCSTHRQQKRFKQMLDILISCSNGIPIRAVVKHDNLAGMALILKRLQFEIIDNVGLYQNETAYFFNFPRKLR